MSLQLQDLLQGQIPDELLEQIQNKLQGADRTQTSKAVSGITAMLTSALARNASNEQGAQSLLNALDRDHDGSILDDIAGLLGGSAEDTTKASDGVGILKHILGNRLDSSVDMVSEVSGLGKEQTGSLMQTLAPVIMGLLGKDKREKGLDAGGLTEMLSKAANSDTVQKNPAMAMITQLLDRDGDGNAMDDIARMGMNMLSQLFKKK